MTKRLRFALLLAVFALLLGAGFIPAQAATGDPVLINETLVSTTSTDVEFVEFYGTPGASLNGLSLIVVESDFGTSNGMIDRRYDFGAANILGSNGYYLVGYASGLGASYGVTPNVSIDTNYLENSSLTIALVQTSSLSGGVGTFVTGSEVALDAVALTDGGASDNFFFGAPVVGPDGTFLPAGARRAANGVDTDTVSDWVISDFNLGPANTPTAGDAPPPPPPPVVTIMEIQGSGQFSPYDDVKVETSGIVTAVTPNGRNFWMQDASGDGDPATSDGIFVALSFRPGVAPGDAVNFVGLVEEQQFYPSLPLTRLRNVSKLTIVSSGNPLPAPVAVTDLPDTSILDSIAYWEPLEGMLVSLADATVISATNGYGEFSVLTPADAVPNSGYYPQTKQILVTDLGDGNVDYNPERIMIDDSTLSDPIVVMPGDVLPSFTGVVDYAFSNYKLQPVSYEVFAHPLPNLPASTRSGPKGDFRISTFNVENLFDLVDNPYKEDEGTTPTPEELETKLAKLTLAAIVELELPDIMIVEETENQAILQVLAKRINDAAGTNYVAVSVESSDERGIEVGFLYDTNRVALLDVYQLTDAHVPGVSAAFGPGSDSPGREPLVGVFDVQGQTITVIGNHFKSKGGDEPLYGVNWPPERITEEQRKLQAQVVRDYLNILLAADPDALILVGGDLNDFAFPEPGEGADDTVSIIEGTDGEVPMTNLIFMEKDDERFTYVFDGNSQVLDHVLVSPALLQYVTAVDILHFNAGYPNALIEDATTPLHVSDHDPVETRFTLPKK